MPEQHALLSDGLNISAAGVFVQRFGYEEHSVDFTLVAESPLTHRVFDTSTDITCYMPDVTTLFKGWDAVVINDSDHLVVVRSSIANSNVQAVGILRTGDAVRAVCSSIDDADPKYFTVIFLASEALVYRALVSQTGTDAPIDDVVMEFNLDITERVTWARTDVGKYTASLAGGFLNQDKIAVLTCPDPDPKFCHFLYLDRGSAAVPGELHFVSADLTGTPDDGLMRKDYVEIRVIR